MCLLDLKIPCPSICMNIRLPENLLSGQGNSIAGQQSFYPAVSTRMRFSRDASNLIAITIVTTAERTSAAGCA